MEEYNDWLSQYTIYRDHIEDVLIHIQSKSKYKTAYNIENCTFEATIIKLKLRDFYDYEDDKELDLPVSLLSKDIDDIKIQIDNIYSNSKYISEEETILGTINNHKRCHENFITKKEMYSDDYFNKEIQRHKDTLLELNDRLENLRSSMKELNDEEKILYKYLKDDKWI